MADTQVVRVAAIVVGFAACSFSAPAVGPSSDGGGVDATSTPDASVPDAPGVDGAAACPASYGESHGTSMYRLGTTSTTWYEAQQACETDGAHLVVIENETENVFVRALTVGGDIWIGLSDHLSEGSFISVTGGAAPMGPPFWQPMEPNNGGGAEDCVELNMGGQWTDSSCTSNQLYVCECDGAAPPAIPTWCETGTGDSCNTCNDGCSDQFDGKGACRSDQVCFDTD